MAMRGMMWLTCWLTEGQLGSMGTVCLVMYGLNILKPTHFAARAQQTVELASPVDALVGAGLSPSSSPSSFLSSELGLVKVLPI